MAKDDESEASRRGTEASGPAGRHVVNPADREGEARLQALVSSLDAIVWELDPTDFMFTYVSPQIEDILGYRAEDVVGREGFWIEILHPEDREWAEEFCKRCTRAGKSHRFEYRVLRADGEVVWIRDIVTVITKDGEANNLTGVMTDITETKQAERELRESQRELREARQELEHRVQERTAELEERSRELMRSRSFLRDILDNTPAAIFAKEAPDFEYRFVNKAFLEATGLERDEVLGHTDYDVFAAELADFYRSRDRRIIRQGEASEVPVEPMETPDGTRQFRVRKVPLHDDLSGSTLVLGVAVDITDRIEMEEQLKESRRRIAEAKAEAEDATRAKSLFLANMSHEVRTPMAGIIGMTELLQDTELNPEQHEYLNLIDQSAHSLLHLLDDILDFSKIEAGELEMDHEAFDLDELIGTTLQTLMPEVQAKGLEMSYLLDADTPVGVEGDPRRLRQVIVNLVNNAIKFTEEGEVVVRVEHESKSATEVGLHIEVTDTGPGIPEPQQEKIFESFRQVDSSLSREYEGSGLGLAISVQIVNAMGGELLLESQEGKGSTFHFTIRLDRTERPTRQDIVAYDRLEGHRVLVADDHSTTRESLMTSMQAFGLEASQATDGQEVLEALEEARQQGQPVEVLVVDTTMPSMRGFEMLDRVREKEEAGDLAIVVMSPAGTPVDMERLEQLGVSRRLSKPVRQLELLKAVARALNLAGGSKANGEDGSIFESGAEAGPLHILVAEDNVVNRKLAVTMLEKRGHTVTTAEDGREVLEALEGGRRDFDLVLMDVQMPAMDGLEATREIREREKKTGERIPIIALTAHAMKGDRERFLAAGMDDYLAKPLEARELMRLIQENARRTSQV